MTVEPAAEIELLLAQADALPDPGARQLHRALVAALVELFGDGLGRVLELADGALTRALLDDARVAPLLALCGLHTDAPAARVARGLAEASSALRTLGVEVVEAVVDAPGGDEAGLRVRLRIARGEVAPAARVRELVEAVASARAPEIARVDVELVGAAVGDGFVPLTRLEGRR
jgi:hypothetical protein